MLSALDGGAWLLFLEHNEKKQVFCHLKKMPKQQWLGIFYLHDPYGNEKGKLKSTHIIRFIFIFAI